MRHTTDPQRQAGPRRGAAIRGRGLVALIAAATLGLAACGGSGGPRVASLPASSTGAGTAPASTTGATTSPSPATTRNGGKSSANKSAKGDPIRLLSEWTECMRIHGDPSQAEPTIDANAAIHVITPAGYFGTIAGPSGQDSTGAGVTCLRYLTAASTALHGGDPLQAPDPATGDKFAACMRANGVSNFPDPGAGAASVSPGSSKPNAKSPSFEKAAKVCAQRYPGAASLGGPATLKAGQWEIDNADGSVRLIFVGGT